jgi:hypothetical protein
VRAHAHGKEEIGNEKICIIAGVGVVQSRSQQFAGDQILVGGIPCVGTANLTEKKRLILSFSAYLNNLTKPLTMRRNMK